MNEITVLLSASDAEMFKEFQQRFHIFSRLITAGVFETKNGSVTLHFDHDGSLKVIEQNRILQRI